MRDTAATTQGTAATARRRYGRGRPRATLTALALLLVTTSGTAPVGARQAGGAISRPAPTPRTFADFVGTWVLDEAVSTGRMSAAPGATVAFAISPTEITLTRTRKLPEQRSNPPDETPIRQVYRMDGAETVVIDGGRRELRGRFLLVSDALVFTTSETPRGGDVNIVTDAYEVAGGVMTARRQLVAVRAPGYIATMQEPSNNHSHTFVYRRARP